MPRTDTPEEKRRKRAAYMLKYYHKNHERELILRRARAEAHREKKAEHNRHYRITHREALALRKRQYYTSHKQEILAKQHATYLANRAHRLVQQRAYYAAHRKEHKQKSDAYRAAHPEIAHVSTARRRARKRCAPINNLTAAQWREIKAAYGYRCVYCGRKCKRLAQDHITPLSKGGPHTASNIVPACQSCNSKKNTGPPLKPVQPLLLTVSQPRAK
jgi:predicted restriction endonuclease